MGRRVQGRETDPGLGSEGQGWGGSRIGWLVTASFSQRVRGERFRERERDVREERDWEGDARERQREGEIRGRERNGERDKKGGERDKR